jgi:HlyD family secretion protein
METAVEQARIALEKAELDLEEATLVAPFDGVITAVNVDAGEVANGILVELFDPNSLEIVLDVDEVDIANVHQGQTALVTLETWPGTEITSEVVSIAPVAKSDNSALVVFEVYLKIGETELPVLLGMTADAALISSDNEEVLLVPNAVINADRNTGTFTVNKVSLDAEGNQVTEEVEVSIGLRDGRFTQITDGLAEGDQVLVGNTLPVFNFGEDEPPAEGPGGNSGGPSGAFGG